MSRSEADLPDGQYRSGLGRRFPALVQLRRQGPAPERHVDPVGASCVEVRRQGGRVVRGSFGRYFTFGIKNSYYLAAIQDKPTLFLTQTVANSAIGTGTLANFIYGVSPLPPVPTNITNLPQSGNNVGAWY